jgi:hypothetical protein
MQCRSNPLRACCDRVPCRNRVGDSSSRHDRQLNGGMDPWHERQKRRSPLHVTSRFNSLRDQYLGSRGGR